ncbi:MAG: RNA polymerase sigma factor [Myxococcaceae bacterium]|nr:RNA polymerase sigma factor [Myxococcaceae bacterium]
MPQFHDATADVAASVRELYVELAPGIARSLGRLVQPGVPVDDLLHDVFVVALRRPETMLRAESPRAWLYGIAMKVAVGARRKQRLRQLLGLADAREPTMPLDPARTLEQREAQLQVTRALHRLDPKKREVLVLFELEGLTGEEVAAAVGCSLNTVWTRLHRARAELKQKLLQLETVDQVSARRTP